MSYPQSYRKHSVEIYFEIPSHPIKLAAVIVISIKVYQRYTFSGDAVIIRPLEMLAFGTNIRSTPFAYWCTYVGGREAFALNLEGLGHAILGNFSTDQTVIELT